MQNLFTEFFVVVVKGAMYYVAVAMVIFSHVKITCEFPVKITFFFPESSPGISLAFI